MAEKTYIGNGKVKETEYGDLISFKLGPNDIKSINKWAETHEGWCTVTIFKRREPSEKGTTHYGVLDTWVPDQSKSDGANTTPKTNTGGSVPAGIAEAYPDAGKPTVADDDNLPF